MKRIADIVLLTIGVIIFLPELIVIAPFLLYMYFTGKLVECDTFHSAV
jgi:maltodextrin utilization protein YvdJ